MSHKIAVVGFPKCGTMSLTEYLKKKYPDAIVERPENIYYLDKENKDWGEYECYSIVRNPVNRIKSGHGFFGILHNKTVQQILDGDYFRPEMQHGVGFQDVIEQSDYNKYITRFEHNYDVKIKEYRFEDMIKDPDFPHINETNIKKEWSEEDFELVRGALKDAGITY